LKPLEQAKPAHCPKKLQSSTNFTKPKQHSPDDQIYNSNPNPPTTQVFCKNPIEFQSNSPPSKPEDFDSEEVDHRLMNALLEIQNNSCGNISHPEPTPENPQQDEKSKTKTIKGIKKNYHPIRLRSNLSQDSFQTIATNQTQRSAEPQKVRKISNATGQISPKNTIHSQNSAKNFSPEKKCSQAQKTQNSNSKKCFECKNPHFDLKNPHFDLKNPHFDLKNPHFDLKNPLFDLKNHIADNCLETNRKIILG
jgi:hypothetical protein